MGIPLWAIRISNFCFILGVAVLEKSCANLSDVVIEYEKLSNFFLPDGSYFNMIKESMSAPETKKAQNIFEFRSSTAKITSLHLMANFLDPRTKHCTFENDEEKLQLVVSAMDQYASDIGLVVTEEDRQGLGEQLSAFRRREGLFGSPLLSSSTPYIYWENFLQFSSTRKIATIGSKILSIPASSADVERSFSIQGHLHSKARNRLLDTNVDKLMRVKWALKQEENQFINVRNMLGEQSPEIEPSVNLIDGVDESGLEIEDAEVDVDEAICLDEFYTETELLDLLGLN